MATVVNRSFQPELKKHIIISYVTEAQVSESKWCNTNNHKWNEFPTKVQENEEKEISKLEYHNEMVHTDYDKFVSFVNVFDKINNPMLKILLTSDESKDLFDIAKIANITGKIPASFRETFYLNVYNIAKQFPVNIFVNKANNISKYKSCLEEWIRTNPYKDYADIPPKYYDINLQYFIRLNECSPKDSYLGMGPFNNISLMFESLIYSCRTRKALQKASDNGSDDNDLITVDEYNLMDFKNNDNDNQNRKEKDGWKNFGNGTYLWCIPWRDDILSSNEFRCFIYKSSLVAITQYVWSKDYNWINKQNILISMCVDIQLLANKITKYIKHNKYVLDIHVLFNNKGYEIEMIECNSFGAQMAAGSGCFHWIRDYDQLHGIRDCKNQIEVRIVVKDDTNIKHLVYNQNKSPTLVAIDALLKYFDK